MASGATNHSNLNCRLLITLRAQISDHVLATFPGSSPAFYPLLYKTYSMQQKAGDEPGNEASHVPELQVTTVVAHSVCFVTLILKIRHTECTKFISVFGHKKNIYFW